MFRKRVPFWTQHLPHPVHPVDGVSLRHAFKMMLHTCAVARHRAPKAQETMRPPTLSNPKSHTVAINLMGGFWQPSIIQAKGTLSVYPAWNLDLRTGHLSSMFKNWVRTLIFLDILFDPTHVILGILFTYDKYVPFIWAGFLRAIMQIPAFKAPATSCDEV